MYVFHHFFLLFRYEQSAVQEITVNGDEPVRLDFSLRPSDIIEGIF